MSRHAYLVVAHQDPYVLERLLRLVDDERNTVFLHLDARFDVDHGVLRRALRRSGLHLVRRRRVHWGDFSQVRVALDLFATAVPGRFDRYHLLSGVDLPLKPQDEVHAFFDRHADREFVGYAAAPFDQRWVTELHFFNRYIRPANRLQYTIRNRGTTNLIRLQRRLGYDHARRFGLELRKGSDWFSVTHELATHLLDQQATVRRLLRLGHAPSEVYMQTLVWNSPFRDRLFDAHDEFRGSARLIDWDRGGPHVFRSEDLDELLASDRMFARKFLSDVDREVVDRLVEHLS